MPEREEAVTPAPQTPRNYLAVRVSAYGVGASVPEAIDTCRKFGGKLSNTVVYVLPEGVTNAWVNDWREVRWDWPADYDGPRVADLEIVHLRVRSDADEPREQEWL